MGPQAGVNGRVLYIQRFNRSIQFGEGGHDFYNGSLQKSQFVARHSGLTQIPCAHHTLMFPPRHSLFRLDRQRVSWALILFWALPAAADVRATAEETTSKKSNLS